MKTRPAVALLASAVTVVLALGPGATTADAQFTKDQLKCRQTLAKEIGKLAKTVGKVIAKCHKNRDKLKIGAGTNCNDVAEADAGKQKVVKTENKFLAKAADPIKGKCTGLSPAELGYFSCPSPCGVQVPVITDFSDVATCAICLAEDSVAAMHLDSQGMPAIPLPAKDEVKCHSQIGKIQDKHLSKVVKDRSKCQKLEEKKNGATDTSVCGGSDLKDKISKSREKSEDKLAKRCAPADLTSLDSCSDVDLASLQACILDDAETRGEALFQAAHSFGDATWTQVLDVFSRNGCADAGCHGNGFSSGGLGDLDDFSDGYTELLSEAVFCGGSAFTSRVVANDPVNSFLVAKLDGSHDCGSLMPQGGPPISDVDLAIVVSWIDDGAPQN